MTDPKSVLDWLNWESSAHISRTNQLLIDQIKKKPAAQEGERLDLIRYLYDATGYLREPLEAAEVLLHCSVFSYEMGCFMEALEYADMAQTIYEGQREQHRIAVAALISYFANHALRKYQAAFFRAKQALKIFFLLEEENTRKKITSYQIWYHERALDTICEMLTRLTDMFEFLFELANPSQLTLPAAKAKERLWKNIEKGEIQQALRETDTLKRITNRSICVEETAEAMILCGVAEFLLAYPVPAVESMKKANNLYLGSSHQYPVTLWITGMALFDTAARLPTSQAIDQRCDAIEYLAKSSERMLAAAQLEDRRHNLESRKWYRIFHEAMKREMNCRSGAPL